MPNRALLTKSRFLAGKQCQKRLWQQIHSPLEDGNEFSPITETGIKVGRLAHLLFPNGALAWSEGQTFSQAVAATSAFVKGESTSAMFEAAVRSGRPFARFDILQRDKHGAWNICEVKSSTEVKDELIDDVAFQLHVAGDECGPIQDGDKQDMIVELDAVVAHLYGLNEKHSRTSSRPSMKAGTTSRGCVKCSPHYRAWRKSN